MDELNIKYPTFSASKSEDVRQFFSKFEKVCDYYHDDERAKITKLGLHLYKHALIGFDTILRKNPDVLFVDIKTEV